MKAELVLGNLKREREALDNKLERLNAALAKDWEDETQEYLCTQQYNAMELYAHILDERIADIEYKLAKRKEEAKTSEPCKCSCEEKSSFKDDSDFNSYLKNYGNTCCNNKCNYEEISIEDIVDNLVDMINTIFGKDTIR